MSFRSRTRRVLTPFLVSLLCLSLIPCTMLSAGNVFHASSEGATRLKAKPAPNAQSQAPHRSNELLVRFRHTASERQKDTVAATIGARRKRQLRGESGVERVDLSSSQDPQTTALQLLLNPAVEFANPTF